MVVISTSKRKAKQKSILGFHNPKCTRVSGCGGLRRSDHLVRHTSVFGTAQAFAIRDRLPSTFNMAQFRAKKLDLGCFTNIKVIRDHTKRKVFEQNEPERYAYILSSNDWALAKRILVSPRCMCTDILHVQASTSLHHPQHLSSSAQSSASAIATQSNALLHPTDTETESMYNGWQRKGYFQGLQNVKSM